MITTKRLYRMVDILRILNARARHGSEAGNVQTNLYLMGCTPISIDTVQHDLNHLVNIGLATKTRCCGDPYWYSLTEMGSRVMAGYTRQEA